VGVVVVWRAILKENLGIVFEIQKKKKGTQGNKGITQSWQHQKRKKGKEA